jgi:glycosyltransferase involved in cell wall biosynthesis
MFGLGLGEVLASVVADKTVVISPGTRVWTPWVREVLADGPDAERFKRPPQREREKAPTVLFVGTYQRRKRGMLLVEAFRRHVLPVNPEAQLWMVSEDCPSFEGVIPLGRVSDERLVDLYHRAWVFCLPSSYEGLGIPYIEAMAAGLPVVATPNPGSRFVLGEGQYGMLTTEEQLGTALAGLLRNSAERERLSKLGLERSVSLSLARAADRYEEIYYQLVGRAAGRRCGH